MVELGKDRVKGLDSIWALCLAVGTALGYELEISARTRHTPRLFSHHQYKSLFCY